MRLGAGVTLVRLYIRAGMVDELHMVMSNKSLGSGEGLFEGTNNVARDDECVETVGSDAVTHIRPLKKNRA